MQKAKSRLKPEKNRTRADSSPGKRLRSRKKGRFLSTRQRYLRHLPLLILSIAGFSLCGYLLLNLYPDQIANWLLPQSYLPLLICFFFSSWFLFSFVLLHTRRGLMVGLIATLALFFKLQQIDNWSGLILIISTPILTLELIWSYLQHSR